MHRVFHVARREFLSTISTKGFIIGVLLMPLLMLAALTLVPLLLSDEGPRVTGVVAVIDQAGGVAPKLVESFTPERLLERRKRETKEMAKRSAARMGVGEEDQKKLDQGVGFAASMGPMLTLEVLPSGTDIEEAKAPILKAQGKASGAEVRRQRLALVVIPPGSVALGDQEEFAAYKLFVAPALDPEVQSEIESEVNGAIVDTRLESAGFASESIHRLIERPRREAKAVTAEGERDTSRLAGILLPMGFMMLTWIAVFTSGQYLLTSLIEEKSSRVMEVLLSAVSPMQLMLGKIAGQMGVGMLIMIAYSTLGVGSLVVFKMGHLLEAGSLVAMVIFFFIAFFLIAAMMASIGSAVSDVREAQTLMTPVMLVLMIPMMLWMPIQRNPNSMFAQVCSFVPPVSPFVMILRLAGSEKVAAWQIPASMVVGIAAAFGACWAAAKIFRVGVLMYGKPPTLIGLVKWIRYA